MSTKITFYGASHSKFYSKSVVADYLVEQDDTTKEVKLISDLHLLLRQQKVHNSIGVNLLRDYVQNMELKRPDKHDFTDDELFRLIEPKDINNITTAYEYARYLKDNSDKVKSRYDDLKREKNAYDEYVRTFHKSSKKDDKNSLTD